MIFVDIEELKLHFVCNEKLSHLVNLRKIDEVFGYSFKHLNEIGQPFIYYIQKSGYRSLSTKFLILVNFSSVLIHECLSSTHAWKPAGFIYINMFYVFTGT